MAASDGRRGADHRASPRSPRQRARRTVGGPTTLAAAGRGQLRPPAGCRARARPPLAASWPIASLRLGNPVRSALPLRVVGIIDKMPAPPGFALAPPVLVSPAGLAATRPDPAGQPLHQQLSPRPSARRRSKCSARPSSSASPTAAGGSPTRVKPPAAPAASSSAIRPVDAADRARRARYRQHRHRSAPPAPLPPRGARPSRCSRSSARPATSPRCSAPRRAARARGDRARPGARGDDPVHRRPRRRRSPARRARPDPAMGRPDASRRLRAAGHARRRLAARSPAPLATGPPRCCAATSDEGGADRRDLLVPLLAGARVGGAGDPDVGQPLLTPTPWPAAWHWRLSSRGAGNLPPLRPRRRSAGGPITRLGLAALHRPGTATVRLSIALGLGLSLLVALTGIGSSLRRAWRPTSRPRRRRCSCSTFPQTRKLASGRSPPRDLPDADLRLVPSLRGPVTAVNGQPCRDSMRFPRARGSCAATAA